MADALPRSLCIGFSVGSSVLFFAVAPPGFRVYDSGFKVPSRPPLRVLIEGFSGLGFMVQGFGVYGV